MGGRLPIGDGRGGSIAVLHLRLDQRRRRSCILFLLHCFVTWFGR